MPLDSFSALQLVLLGLSLLTVGFVLWRGFTRGRRSRGRDLTAEVRKEMLDSEQTISGRMEKLEVRLHDYRREVEGQIETRIALLNQLLIEADSEIKRLRELIAESSRTTSPMPTNSQLSPPSTSEQRPSDTPDKSGG